MSRLYNGVMDISDWTNREIIQIMLARNKISQKELIKKLGEKMQKTIPQSTFANSLWRNNLKLRDFQTICDMLNYSIIVQPKK